MISDIAKRSKDANDTSEGPDDYTTFWEAFGRNIKLGMIEDAANRTQLSKLLRFASSASGQGLTSLDDYVSRKKDNQTSIYYLAADSRAAAEASPYVESLVKRGFEVLYLTEPIDEVAIANLEEFEGMKLADVSRENLALEDTEEAKKELDAKMEELKPLTDYMKKVRGGGGRGKTTFSFTNDKKRRVWGKERGEGAQEKMQVVGMGSMKDTRV